MENDNLVFVVVSVLLVLVIAVAIRQNLFRDLDDMSKAVQIGKHNIDYQLFPDRSRPLILATKELNLRQFYPDFFNKFTREEWQEFWDIIYGTHPLIQFENEKLASADRTYFIQEIQAVLVRRYPEGFSHFTETSWREFWRQIFEISSGVQTNLLQDKQRELSERRLDTKIHRDNARVSRTIERVGTIDELKKK